MARHFERVTVRDGHRGKGRGVRAIRPGHRHAHGPLQHSIDFVIAHVGIDQRHIVCIRVGLEPAIPAQGRQLFRRCRVGHPHLDGAFVQGCIQAIRQGQRVKLAALQPVQRSLRQDRHKILALLPPVINIRFNRIVGFQRLIPETLHLLDDILARHRLICAFHRQRAKRRHQKLHCAQVYRNHPVHRNARILGIERLGQPGGRGEVGRPVGVTQKDQFHVHKAALRFWGAGVVYIITLNRVAVRDLNALDAPLVDPHLAHRADKAAGGAQFLIVLHQQQISVRAVHAQQFGQRRGHLQPGGQQPHRGLPLRHRFSQRADQPVRLDDPQCGLGRGHTLAQGSKLIRVGRQRRQQHLRHRRIGLRLGDGYGQPQRLARHSHQLTPGDQQFRNSGEGRADTRHHTRGAQHGRKGPLLTLD